MAKIQCKMCGGMNELGDGETSRECSYCGMLTTFPKLNTEQREQLYARAERFRQANNFDKAVAAYEAILDVDGEDPEAYWGVLISRYGIEYVEDPVNHERIPTCHRVQFDSILADPDYLNVLKYAVGYDRDIYEKEAKRIAEIQKDILRISAQEKPYDVFICYKETTDGGSRTKDSVLAEDMYEHLTARGLNVFFSRITLEDKLGRQYEPYIFAAVNSAKVMLVVGSKREHFEAVWVRNEWSRFLALKRKDRSKLLIPCFVDMDVYDIPEELSMFQCQDMNKIGFIQDLVRGILKVVNADKPEEKEAKRTAVSAALAPASAEERSDPLSDKGGALSFQREITESFSRNKAKQEAAKRKRQRNGIVIIAGIIVSVAAWLAFPDAGMEISIVAAILVILLLLWNNQLFLNANDNAASGSASAKKPGFLFGKGNALPFQQEESESSAGNSAEREAAKRKRDFVVITGIAVSVTTWLVFPRAGMEISIASAICVILFLLFRKK